MVVWSFAGREPRMGKRVFIAPGAVVVGDDDEVEGARHTADAYLGYKNRYLEEEAVCGDGADCREGAS